MAGVERLMVVQHPLAANPEDAPGPGLLQQSSDFLQSFGITPECAVVGAGVGLFMDPGLSGPVKGALVGSLISMGINWLSSR